MQLEACETALAAGDIDVTSANRRSRVSATPSQLDWQDQFAELRDRFAGLRCAIQGASFSNDADRKGLLQLASDIEATFVDLDRPLKAHQLQQNNTGS